MKKILLFIFTLIMLPALLTKTGFASSLDDVISIINDEYYYTDFNSKKAQIKNIIDGADDEENKIDKIVMLLDKYSKYYSSEYCQNLKENAEAEATDDVIYSFETADSVYIRIDSFTQEAANKFEAIIKNASPQKTLYLDLSSCSGGFIDSMMKISEYLLPNGVVCTATFKNKVEDFVIEESRYEKNRKLYVIVSEKTASSGEILAGAVKKNSVGTVIGTANTFGKTQIQKFFVLENGGILKITVGEYVVLPEFKISETGLEPDYLLIKEAY